MKVISIHQPYATLMAGHYKLIETRRRPMPETVKRSDLVAIHAAKRWNKEQQALAHGHEIVRFYLDLAAKRGLWDFEQPPLGCVVALARYDGTNPTEDLVERITTREYVLLSV